MREGVEREAMFHNDNYLSLHPLESRWDTSLPMRQEEYVYVCACVCARMCVCVCVCVHVHVFVCVYMHVCACEVIDRKCS